MPTVGISYMKDRSSSRLEFSVGRGDVHDDQLSDVEPPSDDELKLDLGRHVISMDSKGADRTLHVVGNCWRRPAQLAKHRSIGTSLRLHPHTPFETPRSGSLT